MPDFPLPAGATLNDDGSIAYLGYTIAPGPAQYDDCQRVKNGDPKAPYLIVMRGGTAPS